jgi:nucleotide-binding universal stress UspA family protein
METILLPTDFSETAKNAGMYAIQLAKQLGANKIVVYHSYEIPVTIDPLVPGIQMLDVESLKTDSEKGLENFRVTLMAFASGMTIETFNEYGALSEGLDEVCSKVNAGLVVMGITGGGALEEKLIGSNAISVAKHTQVPVIIVPPTVQFSRIEEIMLTSDFDKEDRNVPVHLVKKVVAETGARLFVFNVDKDADEEDAAGLSQKTAEGYALHALLEDIKPEFYFSQNKNFVEAVNDFVSEYQIDLIITIPKKHGFFGSLFSEGHTKKLAFHSHVPLMVIHE